MILESLETVLILFNVHLAIHWTACIHYSFIGRSRHKPYTIDFVATHLRKAYLPYMMSISNPIAYIHYSKLDPLWTDSMLMLSVLAFSPRLIQSSTSSIAASSKAASTTQPFPRLLLLWLPPVSTGPSELSLTILPLSLGCLVVMAQYCQYLVAMLWCMAELIKVPLATLYWTNAWIPDLMQSHVDTASVYCA